METMNLHANSISIAVAVIFPGDRLQHPVTPVQNAAKTAKNEMIKSATIDLPISEERTLINSCSSGGFIFY